MHFFNIYRWANLVADSPQETTRNEWLYKYGAFGRLNGLWFPCTVTGYTTIGEPANVMPIRIATYNQDLYPKTKVNVSDMDVLYCVFNDGESIQRYCFKAVERKMLTSQMLNGALQRSLNTEIVTAPTRLIQQIKDAINNLSKGKIRVVNTQIKDDISVIELPHTANLLENLWNSNDYAVQEISQLLGMSFNPQSGKRTRLVTGELLGDRDITLANRNLIVSRLISASKKFGESVEHISDKIDELDRGLGTGGGVRDIVQTTID